MAAAPSNIIKLQRVESETTVQFQIDDLQSCFARPSPTKYSEHFGPGLRFGLYTFSNTGEPSYIGLYLYTSKEHPSMSITWTVHAKSLLGQAYLSKTMSYTFKSGEAIGWSKYLTSEQFHAMQPMKSENAIVLHATLRFTPVWPIVSKPTLDALHRVVVGKGTPDVRYVAYKKRTSNGRLTAPCTLCSSKEAMAQRSEELKDLCETGSNKLSASILKNGEEAKRTTFTNYRDDDSDFEDDDPDAEQEDFDMVDAQPRDNSSPNSAASDRTFAGNEAIVVKSEPISARPSLDNSHQFDGSTVVVLGTAARTWEALLYWLYTGIVVFAPLTSDSKNDRSRFIEQYCSANPDRPSPVSCKSVYRLADALGLDSLKKRALDHLTSQLSMQTYLHELFSPFTSKHDEIRKLEMLAVIKHWDDLKSSAALQEKMVDVVSGKLPHASQILADLLLRTSIIVKEEAEAGPSVKK